MMGATSGKVHAEDTGKDEKNLYKEMRRVARTVLLAMRSKKGPRGCFARRGLDSVGEIYLWTILVLTAFASVAEL